MTPQTLRWGRYVLLLWMFVQRIESRSTGMESDCSLINVEGSLDGAASGTYALSPPTTHLCSGKPVYRQIVEKGVAENYLFYFDSTLEKMADSPYLKGMDARGNASVKNETRAKSSSEESNSDERADSSEEEEEKEEVVYQFLFSYRKQEDNSQYRVKRESDLASRWQSTKPGWMLGPVNCYPFTSRIQTMEKSESEGKGESKIQYPVDPALTWREFSGHAWAVNENLSVTCADAASYRHGEISERTSRIFGGVLLGLICVLTGALIFSLVYKSRPQATHPPPPQELDLAVVASRRERVGYFLSTPAPVVPCPPRRNHLVIFTFPHPGPNAIRSPRPDELEAEEEGEEEFLEVAGYEEGEQERRLLQGDIVAPPAYDELAAITTSSPQPPPTYEEATTAVHNEPVQANAPEHNVPNHNRRI